MNNTEYADITAGPQEEAMENNNVAVLREAMNTYPSVAPGTVVRFTMDQRRYTYTALWVDRKWWLSGVWQAKRRYTNEEFLTDVLTLAEDIEVATQWEQI